MFKPWVVSCVFGEEPGCVYPSIVTGLVITGSAVAGTIVWTPEPTMLKAIVSAPAAALASRIAWRSDPAPASSMLVTVNVAADKDPASKASTAAVPRRRIMDSPFCGREDIPRAGVIPSAGPAGRLPVGPFVTGARMSS